MTPSLHAAQIAVTSLPIARSSHNVSRFFISFVPFAFLLCGNLHAPTGQEAEARLRMALQIARETNGRALVAGVEKLGRDFKRAFPADAEEQVCKVEKSVGIDPGGWSMAGEPLFHPTQEMGGKLKAAKPKLDAAMKSDNAAAVREVTAEVIAILGDQAGVPDGRRAGRKVDATAWTMGEGEAVRLFMDAMKAEGPMVRGLSEGKMLPDAMARTYAYILTGAVTARPFVEKHQPGDLAALDGLVRGVAGILVKLQQPEGHFPFPDLRGKSIRFGDMIGKAMADGKAEVRDGWVVTADPDGGTQFDTGLCGTSLLLAGKIYGSDEWKNAGLRAADWALGQQCCGNFNYNAFSVSLLANAARLTGGAKYLDGALRKFRVGVAPGQAPNGRWLDSHNARTVYHVIIMRALGDLAVALPAEKRAEVESVAKPAVRAMLDEFDAMGVTVEALPELITLANIFPGDTRLADSVKRMAVSIAAKCTDGKRVKMGASPHQLAALPLAMK